MNPLRRLMARKIGIPIRARKLQAGMTVITADGPAKIISIEPMNGENGEHPAFIGDGGEKTAIALRVKLQWMQSPLILHPNQVILVELGL